VTGIKDIDQGEIEHRKERLRRAWGYRKVDHIPLAYVLDGDGSHTPRELCEDGGLQLEASILNIDRLLRLLPDDYLPVARFWPGYMTIATMFGMEIHWSDDPSQPPGVRGKKVTCLADLRGLRPPDPRSAGIMPSNLAWLKRFRDRLPPLVSLAGLDRGGPLNTAKDLFETDLLFTAMYDAPEELARFLELAASVQLGALELSIAAAGGVERMSSIDFDPVWAPEGKKGFISDDVSAGISPELFTRFCMPANGRIFSRWPGGRLHNCGPHPAVDLYLDHTPPIDGLNCSFRYTQPGLERIRNAFRGRGIVELMFDNGETGPEILRGYEEAANALAPEVVAIPVVWMNDSWTDDAIRALDADLRPIAARYAAEMRWKDDP
jgi:Uroporphyrinogen decarboxylase (URO-D)